MKDERFTKSYEVRWDQLDPIGHLRAPVIIDIALNTQMSWISSYGYGQDKLSSAGYDPIILKLEVKYKHEAAVGETLIDMLQLSGLWHKMVSIVEDLSRNRKRKWRKGGVCKT